MKVWVRGSVYFALVFCVGFALGVVRVFWVAPNIGERAAELVETPLMLGASFLFARLVVRRFPARTRLEYLASGMLALALLLAFEFTVVLGLRGLSMEEYFASRDPVSGAVYAGSLVLFALLPWLVSCGTHAASTERQE